MGRTCSTRVGCEKFLQIFVRKPESKRQFGKYNRQWADNAKMGLKYKV
jgi:hypothetical protein